MALPHQFCARATSMSLRRTVVAPSLVLIENAKCSPEAKCVGWLFQSLHSCEVAQPPSTSATTALITIPVVHDFIGVSPLLHCLARTVNTPTLVWYRTLVLLAHRAQTGTSTIKSLQGDSEAEKARDLSVLAGARRAAIRPWSHGGPSGPTPTIRSNAVSHLAQSRGSRRSTKGCTKARRQPTAD